MCPPRKIFASVSLRKSTVFTISEVRVNNQTAAVIRKPTHRQANSRIGEGAGRAVVVERVHGRTNQQPLQMIPISLTLFSATSVLMY